MSELARKFPDAKKIGLLQPGAVLGPDGDSDAAEALWQVKCEAARVALEEIPAAVNELVTKTVHRLRRANNWEAAGSLLGICGTATALAILWPAQAETEYARIASGLGLIGSLIALAPKTLRKTFFGTSENMTKLLTEAQDAGSRAEQLLPILRHGSLTKSILKLEEVHKAIADSENLIRRVRQLILEIG